VLRTGQTVAFDDVWVADDPLLVDPYLELRRPRAVLAVPIDRRGDRLGVLYLEHKDTPGAFTERNREFLRVLVGQIAISLTNARLYADLQSAQASAEAARRAAEQASEAKSFFLAKMSHELRTPLNAILGYTELVGEQLTDANVHAVDEELSRIRLAGGALSQLIGNILDMTKIEGGRLELYRERFSPAELLQELRGTVEPEIRAARNRLMVEPEGLPSHAVSDRQKLRQVLLNLLGNANKYTAGGVVTLRGSTRGDRLLFEVIDTGSGIDPAHHELVFRPFVQVDNSYTRKFDGAGLGLAICRELCAALGGALSLDSELGRGSRFTVEIPLE
jgi:signal transduction histidine kinase